MQWIDQPKLEQHQIDYVHGLETITPLRQKNNEKILQRLSAILPEGAEGLEVGSAIGLFLEQAEAWGFHMTGIEPMEKSWQIAVKKKLNAVHGFFPQDLPVSDPYDFIIFNDVFEHLPSPREILQECRKRLKGNGCLIINLPDSAGILYRCAAVLHRFGDNDTLKRLWQVETESPHLYYFNQKSLTKLAAKEGFTLAEPPIRMLSFLPEGIQKRVTAMPIHPVKAKLLSAGLFVGYPILKHFPSDTRCYIFKKE